MSDVLRAKFENQESAVEILDSLQEIFGQKNEQACIEITGKYTTARMKTETHVRDYIMITSLRLSFIGPKLIKSPKWELY